MTLLNLKRCINCYYSARFLFSWDSLFQTFQINDSKTPVDISQLNQSRLGLISQACMLLVTVLFILSDILGEFWKDK